jgi:hypothetical protein
MRRIELLFAILFCIGSVCSQNTADLGDELANLNFANILGGPLIAVIDAQAQASRTTIDFLDELAFKEINGTKSVVMASFIYQKLDNGTLKDFTFQLPFMTLLPIPYIEIQEISLSFK